MAEDRPADGRRRWRVVVPALLALGILVGSVLPVSTGGGTPHLPFLPADTVAHLSLYLLLGGSVAWARSDWGAEPLRTGLVIFGFVFLYGAGIEVIQSAIPYRDFSLLDMAANGVGAGVGILVGRWLGRRRGS